jgi:hypothetical protein
MIKKLFGLNTATTGQAPNKESSYETIGAATLELIQFKIAIYEAGLKGKDAPVIGGRKVQPTS